MYGQVTLNSSDTTLVKGFGWAKSQALAYVFDGDPVGDWYEAALPGREAFCMRDVAHQSNGAQLLGLRNHTYNMLHKFAANIAESRDWCTFWEIDRYDRPCPVDYTSDGDFWYNLPANFDVLHCCYRQYLWTGDRRYLDDPMMRNFYARTVDDYVRRWDRDGDGVPEHYPAYGRRGIASYNEEVVRPAVGADLIAAQFGAYRAYAALLNLVGQGSEANTWTVKAAQLRAHYEHGWWHSGEGRFAGLRRHNGAFDTTYAGITHFFPLYFDLVQDERKVQATLAEVVARRARLGVEERSYLPEIFYAYGEQEVAYAELLEQMAPGYRRREYPEVAYALLGAVATGLMGITPDAATRTAVTCPALGEDMGWVELSSVPFLDTLVDIRHDGCHATTIANRTDASLTWQATFPGHVPLFQVDREAVEPAHGYSAHDMPVSWVTVPLSGHTSCTVAIAGCADLPDLSLGRQPKG
jgi:hypothetical protein